MRSVSERIDSIKQPRGGYLSPSKMFSKVEFGGLPPYGRAEENVAPSLVGVTVDYLTRFMLGSSVKKAFRISIEGARKVNKTSFFLLRKVKGLDDRSISAAVRLAVYDAVYRAGRRAYKPLSEDPNPQTLANIRAMVGSCLEFFDEYGPVVSDGMTFIGGYAPTVRQGDCDYVTADGL